MKEFKFEGTALNGFVMLFVNIVMFLLGLFWSIRGIDMLANYNDTGGYWQLGIGIVLFILGFIFIAGYVQLEPNVAKVTTWFGKYSGTFTRTGLYWINPFYGKKKVSLRARNLDAEPIKVNDKTGNPIMIGLVLVW